MIDIQKEYGISPAVGVILLLGITVGISTVAGIVLLDIGDDGLTESVNAGVEVQETPDGVEVSWNQKGNADQVSVRVDGEEVTRFKDIDDSIRLGVDDNTTVTAVGVTDSDSEQVVSQSETTKDTRDGSTGSAYTVEENNVKSQKVTGTISLNPKIGGANVKSIKDGSVIDTTETDSEGKYELVGEPGAKINVTVEGDVEYNSKKIYARGSAPVGEDMRADVDFDETKLVNVDSDKAVVATTKISTAKELQAMKHDLDEDYELVNDIDASETQNWNGGSGFEPIGEFTGSLDGNGYTVSNLHIDRSSTSKVGLFSRINSGSVSNLSITSAQINGSSTVGVLAGEAVNTNTFSNISVNGTVTAADSSTEIGGLFGFVEGSLSNITNKSTIEASNAEDHIGGVAGYSSNATYNTVSNEGTVIGNVDTGGISGKFGSSVSASDVTNSGDVTGRYQTGGVVGHTRTTVDNASNTGTVTIKIASNQSGALQSGGGIAGRVSYAEITNSTNSGTVDGTTGIRMGGIAGNLGNSTVDLVHNDGTVKGDEPGGVVGYADSSQVKNSYNTGSVSTDGNGRDATVGGVVNYARESTITNVYNTGTITGTGSIGGVLNMSDSSTTLENSYNTGTITGTSTSDGYVGGVVGYAEESYSVSEVYNTGSISVPDGYDAGGVAGVLKNGTISDAYNRGSVSGRGNIAGFVADARTNAVIENSYTTGSVSADRSTVGGFAASADSGATFTEAYWDTEASGQTASSGDAVGLTTSEMQSGAASSNMTFDYNTIWKTTNGYPEFQ